MLDAVNEDALFSLKTAHGQIDGIIKQNRNRDKSDMPLRLHCFA